MTEDIVRKLIDSGLTIEQYFILQLLHEENPILDYYVDNTNVDSLVFQDLHVRGYISLLDNNKGYRLDNIISNYHTQFDLFEDIKELPPSKYDELWDEFINTYPKSELKRRLHNNRDEAKKKYVKYLKEGLDHSKVIDAIRKEIQARKHHAALNKFFPPWKLLTTYVNQKSWEAYFDDDDENEITMEDELLY